MPQNLKPSSHPNLLSFLDFFGQEMRLLKQFQPLWFVALFLPNWQKSNIKICPCQYSVKSILWFSRLLALKELWTYFSWLCNFWINFPSMGKILRSRLFVRFTTYQQVATAAFMYWNVLHTSHSVGYLIGRSSHAFSEPNMDFFSQISENQRSRKSKKDKRGWSLHNILKSISLEHL